MRTSREGPQGKIQTAVTIILVVYLGLIVSEFKSFIIPAQIEYIYQVEAGIKIDDRPELDIWVQAPRYWLMAPIFTLSEITGVAANTWLGIVMLLLATVSWRLIVAVTRHKSTANTLPELALFIVILEILSFMSGRMFFAFASIAVLLYLDNSIYEESYHSGIHLVATYLFAAWCASVASGSFLAFMTLSAAWLLFRIPLEFRNTKMYMMISIAFLALTPLTVMMIAKVFLFYGADPWAIYGIIQHGLGKYPWLFICAVLLFPFIAVRIYSIRKSKNMFAWLTAVVGMGFSVVGSSSFIITVPALLVVAYGKYLDLFSEANTEQHR